MKKLALVALTAILCTQFAVLDAQLIKHIPYQGKVFSNGAYVYKFTLSNGMIRHSFFDGDFGGYKSLLFSMQMFSYNLAGKEIFRCYLPIGLGYSFYSSHKVNIGCNSIYYWLNYKQPDFGEASVKAMLFTIPDASSGIQLSAEVSLGYRYFFSDRFKKSNRIFLGLSVGELIGVYHDALPKVMASIQKKNYRYAVEMDSLNTWTEYMSIYPDEVARLRADSIGKSAQAIMNMDWKTAKTTNTIKAFEDFRAAYPNSEFDAQAMAMIQDIEWALAKKYNIKTSYESYLKTYPEHANAALARQAIQDLCELDWKKALSRNTIQIFQDFASTWPESIHAFEVPSRIETLREAQDWQQARERNTVAAYNGYLQNWPAGTHKSTAEQALIKLDDESWLGAQKTGNMESFGNYIKQYPGGLHFMAAQDSLWSEIMADQKGWRFTWYLDNFPAGKYAQDAKNQLEQIEESFWREVIKSRRADFYEGYLEEYPSGKHSFAARDSIAALELLRGELMDIEAIEASLISDIKSNGAGKRYRIRDFGYLSHGSYCLDSESEPGNIFTYRMIYPSDNVQIQVLDADYMRLSSMDSQDYDIIRFTGKTRFRDTTFENQGDVYNYLTFIFLGEDLVYLRGKGKVTDKDGSVKYLR